MSDVRRADDGPFDPDAVDRLIRINELSEQAKQLGLGQHHVSDDCPPEVQEEFLRNMIEYESTPLSTKFEQLTRAGVELPVPESISDADMHRRLWDLINALARHDSYLYNTNHLSDRELYSELWHDILREQGPILPPGSGWINGIDLIGGGSEEDIQIGLRYYDSAEQRASWAARFPRDHIPPHEDPPHDRDRHLPKSPHEFICPPEGVDGMYEIDQPDGEGDEWKPGSEG